MSTKDLEREFAKLAAEYDAERAPLVEKGILAPNVMEAVNASIEATKAEDFKRSQILSHVQSSLPDDASSFAANLAEAQMLRMNDQFLDDEHTEALELYNKHLVNKPVDLEMPGEDAIIGGTKTGVKEGDQDVVSLEDGSLLIGDVIVTDEPIELAGGVDPGDAGRTTRRMYQAVRKIVPGVGMRVERGEEVEEGSELFYDRHGKQKLTIASVGERMFSAVAPDALEHGVGWVMGALVASVEFASEGLAEAALGAQDAMDGVSDEEANRRSARRMKGSRMEQVDQSITKANVRQQGQMDKSFAENAWRSAGDFIVAPFHLAADVFGKGSPDEGIPYLHGMGTGDDAIINMIGESAAMLDIDNMDRALYTDPINTTAAVIPFTHIAWMSGKKALLSGPAKKLLEIIPEGARARLAQMHEALLVQHANLADYLGRNETVKEVTALSREQRGSIEAKTGRLQEARKRGDVEGAKVIESQIEGAVLEPLQSRKAATEKAMSAESQLMLEAQDIMGAVYGRAKDQFQEVRDFAKAERQYKASLKKRSDIESSRKAAEKIQKGVDKFDELMAERKALESTERSLRKQRSSERKTGGETRGIDNELSKVKSDLKAVRDRQGKLRDAMKSKVGVDPFDPKSRARLKKDLTREAKEVPKPEKTPKILEQEALLKEYAGLSKAQLSTMLEFVMDEGKIEALTQAIKAMPNDAMVKGLQGIREKYRMTREDILLSEQAAKLAEASKQGADAMLTVADELRLNPRDPQMSTVQYMSTAQRLLDNVRSGVWDADTIQAIKSETFALQRQRAKLDWDKMHGDFRVMDGKGTVPADWLAYLENTSVSSILESTADAHNVAVSPGAARILNNRAKVLNVQKADSLAHRITQSIKFGWTAGNLASATANFMSNVTMNTLRFGLDPLGTAIDALTKFSHVREWQTTGLPPKGMNGATAAQSRFIIQQMEDVGFFNNSIVSEVELGSAHSLGVELIDAALDNPVTQAAKQKVLAASDKVGALKATEFAMSGARLPLDGWKKIQDMNKQAYTFGDTAFKTQTVFKEFAEYSNMTAGSVPGDVFKIPVERAGVKKTVTIERTQSGWMEDGRPVDPQKVFVEAGIRRANEGFVDYGNSHWWTDKIRSMPVMPIFSPFVSWMHAAIDIPGVKRGFFAYMTDVPGAVSTTSQAGLSYKITQQANIGLRRLALITAARDDLWRNQEQIAQVLAGSSKKTRAMLVHGITDPMVADVTDFSTANALAPTMSIVSAVGSLLDGSKMSEEDFTSWAGWVGADNPVGSAMTELFHARIKGEISKQGELDVLTEIAGLQGSAMLGVFADLMHADKTGNVTWGTKTLVTALFGGTAWSGLKAGLRGVGDPVGTPEQQAYYAFASEPDDFVGGIDQAPLFHEIALRSMLRFGSHRVGLDMNSPGGKHQYMRLKKEVIDKYNAQRQGLFKKRGDALEKTIVQISNKLKKHNTGVPENRRINILKHPRIVKAQEELMKMSKAEEMMNVATARILDEYQLNAITFSKKFNDLPESPSGAYNESIRKQDLETQARKAEEAISAAQEDDGSMVP